MALSSTLPPSSRMIHRWRVNNPEIDTGAPSGKGDAYSTFKAKYRDDPAGFIRDCIDWRADDPAGYQLQAAGDLARFRREAIRGPHGLGKTAFAAWIIHWFALTRDGDDDWKAPTTASAWRQLTKYLWPEIHKWARRLKWDVIGREPYSERSELLTLSLKLSTGEAFALASNQPELLEGAHGEQLLYLFDEAKVIPDGTWDSAEGAFSTGECYWLAISTPGEPQGRFYDIHKRKPGYGDWNAKHVTLGDAIQAGRIDREWAEKRKAQWGEKSAVYQNRVEGNFASSEEDGVIPLSWIEAANERWLEWVDAGKPGEFIGVGVDVGSGGDKSVYALRWGNAVDELRRDNVKDTMIVTGKAKGIVDAYGGKVVIDAIGIGSGPLHRLREQGVNVDAFVASAKTDRRSQSGELGFVNRRSAAWWNMREILHPEFGVGVALPPDDDLTGDLTAPHWRVMSGGRIQIESKEDIIKRLKRSTDSGDAVVQVFDPGEPQEQKKKVQSWRPRGL